MRSLFCLGLTTDNKNLQNNSCPSSTTERHQYQLTPFLGQHKNVFVCEMQIVSPRILNEDSQRDAGDILSEIYSGPSAMNVNHLVISEYNWSEILVPCQLLVIVYLDKRVSNVPKKVKKSQNCRSENSIYFEVKETFSKNSKRFLNLRNLFFFSRILCWIHVVRKQPLTI